jgi:hypothetical protein
LVIDARLQADDCRIGGGSRGPPGGDGCRDGRVRSAGGPSSATSIRASWTNPEIRRRQDAPHQHGHKQQNRSIPAPGEAMPLWILRGGNRQPMRPSTRGIRRSVHYLLLSFFLCNPRLKCANLPAADDTPELDALCQDMDA